jgi:hypothetical protein
LARSCGGACVGPQGLLAGVLCAVTGLEITDG